MVSVVMPVYNGEKHLEKAIKSILSQSYYDFEFLIINDASTDKTAKIIHSFSDKRIILINNKVNLGQANSQNIGLRLARGEYIVRMDADDISMQNRIEKQVKFMESNPEIGISGTAVRLLVDIHKKRSFWRLSTTWSFPANPEIARCSHLFQPSMCHPAVIMRRCFLINNNLFYRSTFETTDDYDLFVRAADIFPVSNISDVLLLYRIHSEQISNKSFTKQTQLSKKIRLKLLNQLNLFPSKEELRIHNIISESQRYNTEGEVLKALAWLERLENANEVERIYKASVFSKYLAEKWLKVCKYASHFGLWTYRTYNNSKYSKFNNVGAKQKVKLFIMCISRITPLTWKELITDHEQKVINRI